MISNSHPQERWIEGPSEPEIPLLGGDVTEGVVRVGATVRRPMGRNAVFIHALLRHLDQFGFEGAPRYLGVDSAGREVLTFIEGEVAGRPHPAWIADENQLASVGRLLRRYDDAAASFVAPEGVELDLPADPPGLPAAPAYENELIGHLDITPENVVFRDQAAYALIDFDLVRPATRADELYNAMLWWAPLNEPDDVDPGLRGLDAPRRCRILADAYGMVGPGPQPTRGSRHPAHPPIVASDEAPRRTGRRRLAAYVGRRRRRHHQSPRSMARTQQRRDRVRTDNALT
jgi:hypothetical protein